MAKFTLKLSAKADVFTTVEVDAESEEEAVAKALNPAFAIDQDWSHYPGSFIPGTQVQETVECELGDPLPIEEEGVEVVDNGQD